MKASEYYKDFGDGDLAANTLRNKYLYQNEEGPEDMWRRVAQAIASVEKPSDREHWNEEFLRALTDFRFIPGGRILHAAGTSYSSTLTNCYVNEIKADSLPAIYQALTEEALTYQSGGGVGHDLSVLRPRGTKIASTGGISCGPVGFMNLFSENTNTISQHGRRGANMQTLRVDHPDIEEFISVKNDDNRTKVQYSNISVLITDEFMEAVEHNDNFALRWGGTVFKRVRARELWDKIINMAHASAEPGIIFWDRMRQYHNGEYCSPLVSTNPCGEQPLPDGGNCNLGALNLSMMTRPNGTPGKHGVDEDAIREYTRLGVRFMDNVIDYNADRHSLKEQKERALGDRRVGLGITGLADMLIKLQVPYDSEEALRVADRVLNVIRDAAYETSVELAKEKGAFPSFNWSGYRKSQFVKELPADLRTAIREHGIRNVTLLTVAPVGTGSIIAGTSSGIEPIFLTSYKRRVRRKEGDGFDEYDAYHPLVYQQFVLKGKKIPDYVRESHSIDAHFRVRMQGVVQKYIDSSISSTVNLPNEATVATVRDIYEFAYERGLKGITVYREGCREGILQSNEPSSTEEEVQEVHPYNAGKLLTPVPRPQRVMGITEEVSTGEGDMLVTINEDHEGRLVEVIARLGKAGGNEAAQSEAIGRVMSVAFRSGVDPRVIIKQLKGITARPLLHSFEGDEKSTWIMSTPDGIAKVLERHLDAKANKPAAPVQVAMSKSEPEETPQHYTQCNQCGELSVIKENGCERCINPDCGWAAC
jgi:ribonucleoside-diphosphate reductase alpha chain